MSTTTNSLEPPIPLEDQVGWRRAGRNCETVQHFSAQDAAAGAAIHEEIFRELNPGRGTDQTLHGRTCNSIITHPHSPTMTIESWPRVGEDVLAQRSIVLRMCLLRPGPGFPCGVGDECFLPGHGDEPAPCLGHEIGPVGLQPVTVPPGTLGGRCGQTEFQVNLKLGLTTAHTDPNAHVTFAKLGTTCGSLTHDNGRVGQPIMIGEECRGEVPILAERLAGASRVMAHARGEGEAIAGRCHGLQWNSGIVEGRPTRMKNRAKACEKCSRNGGLRRHRGPSRVAWSAK